MLVPHRRSTAVSLETTPFVQCVSNPNLFKGAEVSEKEGRAIVAEYKRQYKIKVGLVLMVLG